MSDNAKLALVLAAIIGVFLLLGLVNSPKKDFAKVFDEYKQNGKQDKVSPADISESFNN